MLVCGPACYPVRAERDDGVREKYRLGCRREGRFIQPQVSGDLLTPKWGTKT